MIEDTKAPFLSHLSELRKSVIRSALAVAALFPLCWHFRFEIMRKAVEPATAALPPGGELIFTRPSEGFGALVGAAAAAAFVLAMPFTLYNLWRFVSPGLKRREKRDAAVFIASGSALFFAGVVFCHAVAAPRAMEFLLAGQSADFMSAMPALGQTLSFLLTLCVSFGIVFEFPLAAFFLSKWGIADSRRLAAARKYAYVAGAVGAAVLTPTTDMASMLMLFAPMVLFYEIGVWVARAARADAAE